jgi:hypothetical protein
VNLWRASNLAVIHHHLKRLTECAGEDDARGNDPGPALPDVEPEPHEALEREGDEGAGRDEHERGEKQEKADGGQKRVVATGHLLEADTRQGERAPPISRAALQPLRWLGAASVRGRTCA